MKPVPPHPSSDELEALRDRLEEVSLREAAYRLQSVHDYLDLHARFREQGEIIGGRGTLIHKLHLAQIESKDALHAAHADLEYFIWKRHAAEIAQRKTWSWKLRSFLRSFAGGRDRDDPAARDPNIPAGDFVYFLHTSPYRLFRQERFVLRGWCFPRSGGRVTAVRARLAGREFAGTYGIAEPEVAARHSSPENPLPGFEIVILTPPGKHWLRLEACIEGRNWFSILNAPLWCVRDSGHPAAASASSQSAQ